VAMVNLHITSFGNRCSFTSFLHTNWLCRRLLAGHGIQKQLLTWQTKQQVSEQAWLTVTLYIMVGRGVNAGGY
jgi:hypothetical protein